MMRPLLVRLQSRAAGFTVIEMTVSLLVLTIVLLGMLSLFDFANRLSSVQTNVSDMQQSLRIAQQDVIRTVRMAGRGPIPLAQPPAGIAAAVWDQVPAGTRIGGNGTPAVATGTDILTVRGVFSSPIYQINSASAGAFDIQKVPGGFTGMVVVQDRTPTSIPQDLTPLREAVLSAQENPARPRERLVLVTAQNAGIWLITAIDPLGSSVTATQANLAFNSVPVDDPVYFDMSSLAPQITDVEADVTSIAYVGILEEHRFYVREIFDTAPNGTQDLAHRFSRARVFPGTDRPWRGRGDDAAVGDPDHASWRMDVADNIMDLQVALAFDSPRGGGRMTDDENNVGNDDRIFESADGIADDWLFNDTQPVNPADWANQQLYFIRLTTLARTDRRDKWYQSPELVRLENHSLTASRLNNRTDRMFRYRPLQTLIDMRNM
jgi:type II secretory pathway pseudopilin PulG